MPQAAITYLRLVFPRIVLVGLTLVGLALFAPRFVSPCHAEEPEPLPIEIQGSRRGGERFDITLALSIPDRPVRTQDDQAYSPIAIGVDGNPLYAALQPRMKIRDRVSVSHNYADDSGDGTYLVTAIVTIASARSGAPPMRSRSSTTIR